MPPLIMITVIPSAPTPTIAVCLAINVIRNGDTNGADGFWIHPNVAKIPTTINSTTNGCRILQNRPMSEIGADGSGETAGGTLSGESDDTDQPRLDSTGIGRQPTGWLGGRSR